MRPRVLSALSGEKLYLDDALETLIQDGRPGAVCVYGPPASGKTTALAWLAGQMPTLSITRIFDEPRSEVVAEYKGTTLVVYSAPRPFGFDHRATFALAPWGEDELIDCLRGVPKDRCASVLARVRAAAEEDWPSWPEMWRICLDIMVGDPSVATPRDAVRCALDRLLPPEARSRARIICLERGIRGTPEEAQLWSNPEFLASLVKQEVSEGALRFLRYGAVRVALAAEQVVEDLAEGRASGALWQKPERNIVLEVARACATRPEALERLKAYAGGGDRTPMAASLLVAAEPGWRPSKAAGWYLKLAHLDGARWEALDLTDAHLEGCSLADAALRGALLNGVYADGASFRGADLSGAAVQIARFVEANLDHVRMARAAGGEGLFRGCSMRGADLSEAKIPGAQFHHADLSGASFRDADLRDAVFFMGQLKDVDFRGADLRGADLAAHDLRQVKLDSARMERILLNRSNLEGSVLHEADLGNAVLAGACLTGSTWPRAHLQEAVLFETMLADIRWEGADLRGADLRNSTFQLGTSRSGLVFGEPSQGTRTGFYEDPSRERWWRRPAEVRVADLRGADLRGAVLEGTDFFRVDLRGAKLDPSGRDYAASCGAIMG